MKHADMEKLHEAVFITGEQRRKIIAHFGLKEEGQAQDMLEAPK